MVRFFQSLQGTVWQERLLFLQQNTEVYRWVAVGIIVAVHLIFGITVLLISRKKLYMNIGAMAFVPVIDLLILPTGVVRYIVKSIPKKEKRVKEKKVKKVSSSDEIDLGFSSDSDEDEGIDLF